MKEVDFYFDFASPNAYLSLMAGKELEDKLGFKFNIKLALLGGIFKLTNNQPPMVAFAGIKNKLDYDGVEMQRFINKHNLSDFKMNPNFPVITLQIMRAAVVAEKEGFLWTMSKKLQDPCGKEKRKWMILRLSRQNTIIGVLILHCLWTV